MATTPTTQTTPTTPRCITCHDTDPTTYPPARAAAGYNTCLPCGERQARQARNRWCVAPLNKSNYVLITDHTLLRGLNPKRTV